MNLVETAAALVARKKGILAIDESNGTCDARFIKLGIPSGLAARRAYREMLLTAPGLNRYVSGAILYDETIRQATATGKPFLEVMDECGILAGIKVDTGTETLAGSPLEKLTHGLDGLRKRIGEYQAMGARFAKWRAVIKLGPGMPSAACVSSNAQALAIYAGLCQEGGLVPIVEPEILMEGAHSLEDCFAASNVVLRYVFDHLARHDVVLEGIVLKPSMVIAGDACPTPSSIEDVATATIKSLKQSVPAAVSGVAFLSGGQSNETATAHLQAMNVDKTSMPWRLTFSFGRALQQPALLAWSGNEANVTRAQAALVHRAACNSAASSGRYSIEMEQDAEAVLA